MVLLVNGFHAVGVDVGVDLRGGHVGVAEELLDDTEVCAGREQVGGEGVPEGVGVDLPEAGLAGGFDDELPEGDAGEGSAGAREEDAVGAGARVLAAAGGLEEDGTEGLDVGLDSGDGDGVERDEAFFAALAQDADDAEVEVEVGELEVGEFAGTEAGGVEELEDGGVARGELFAWVDGGQQGVDLFAAQNVGQLGPAVRLFEVDGRVDRAEPAGQGEFVEHLERGDVADDGGGFEVAVLLEELEVAADGFGGSGEEGLGEGFSEGGEGEEVGAIGRDGVGREAELHLDVEEELSDGWG